MAGDSAASLLFCGLILTGVGCGSENGHTPHDGSDLEDIDPGEDGIADVIIDRPEDCSDPCGPESICCLPGEKCRYDTCVPDLGPCETDADCLWDSYCDDGECIPYGVGPRGPYNDECIRIITPGIFNPIAQCTWPQEDEEFPFPDYVPVLATPVVGEVIPIPDDPHPQVVFITAGAGLGRCSRREGVVRIIDGRTCELKATLEDDLVEASTSPAIGDIDGDGLAEIVAVAFRGGIVAFEYVAGAWQLKWKSTNRDGTDSSLGDPDCIWSAPSIADLDDDGLGEVIFEGVVHDGVTGVIIGNTGYPYPFYFRGNFSVVADVDGDDEAELVIGNDIFQYDPASGFVHESYFAGTSLSTGLVAIADFGEFAGSPPGAPEIVVIGNGARLQSIHGDVLFGPISLPGGGTGGPPTVGDFDGDGKPEFAAADRDSFTVYDPEAAGGILWTQPSQDHSSSCTGSSVFDFEGDGRSEAIYADECFVRVYDGETGEVIFSAWRPSSTWYENPVIVDVDADFNTEIVVATNAGGGHCPDVDPIHPGIKCENETQCIAECSGGYCRCTNDDECPEGYGCLSPLDGSGENVCRAVNMGPSAGIIIYRDMNDSWVSSRRLWNQHAYFITNINDDLTVPRTSEALMNWEQDDLNNFRENVQGDMVPGDAVDLTIRDPSMECTAGGGAEFTVTLCNRGTKPAGSGTRVAFYIEVGGELEVLCIAETTGILRPGLCETIRCTSETRPLSSDTVYVVADPDSNYGECIEENNSGVLEDIPDCALH